MENNRRVIILRDGDCSGCGGDWTVASGESVEVYQLCTHGTHSVNIHLAEGARAKVVFVAAAKGEVAYNYHINLDGEGAEAEVYGVMMVGGKDKVRVHTEMRHNAPHCHSNQQVRGVADDEGYALFDGLVYVAPDAQQTEAYQQSRNILLSPAARIQTQPQLEIYADDVKCSHGATVGQMNEEQIYYMRQRGLSEEDARRLQLGGFMQEILDKVDDEALREEMAVKVL